MRQLVISSPGGGGTRDAETPRARAGRSPGAHQGGGHQRIRTCTHWPARTRSSPCHACQGTRWRASSAKPAARPEMNGSANGGISADYPFARVKAASDAGAAAAHRRLLATPAARSVTLCEQCRMQPPGPAGAHSSGMGTVHTGGPHGSPQGPGGICGMLTEPPESLAAVNAERFSMLVSSSAGGGLGRPGLRGDGHQTGCPAGSPGGRLGCPGAGRQRPWIGGRHLECRPGTGCAGRAHGAARCVFRCAAAAACRRQRLGGRGTAQAAVRGRTPGDHDHSAWDACSDVDRLPRRQGPGQAVSPRCSSGRARKAVRRAALRGSCQQSALAAGASITAGSMLADGAEHSSGQVPPNRSVLTRSGG
jgi:hypothetical protein